MDRSIEVMNHTRLTLATTDTDNRRTPTNQTSRHSPPDPRITGDQSPKHHAFGLDPFRAAIGACLPLRERLIEIDLISSWRSSPVWRIL